MGMNWSTNILKNKDTILLWKQLKIARIRFLSVNLIPKSPVSTVGSCTTLNLKPNKEDISLPDISQPNPSRLSPSKDMEPSSCTQIEPNSPNKSLIKLSLTPSKRKILNSRAPTRILYTLIKMILNFVLTATTWSWSLLRTIPNHHCLWVMKEVLFPLVIRYSLTKFITKMPLPWPNSTMLSQVFFSLRFMQELLKSFSPTRTKPHNSNTQPIKKCKGKNTLSWRKLMIFHPSTSR